MRGLKHTKGRCEKINVQVAPYVGAWIETPLGAYAGKGVGSHPTWVRGLKLGQFSELALGESRTLRGCVD